MAKFSQKNLWLGSPARNNQAALPVAATAVAEDFFFDKSNSRQCGLWKGGKGGGALEKKVSRKISYGNFRPKVRGRRAQKVHICRRKKIRRDQNVKYGPHGPSLAPKVNKFRRRLWAIIGNTPEHAFY